MQPVTLDLGTLPERDRFPAWRAIAEPFFDVSLRDGMAAPFAGRVRTTTLGEALLVDSTVSGQSYERDAARALAGNWDQVALQVYRSGSFTGDYDGRAVSAGPGDINVIDFTKPYRKISTDESDLNLIVPRCWASRLFPGFAHGLVLPAASGEAAVMATCLERLAEMAPTMTAEEAGSVIEAVLLLAAKGPMRHAAAAVRAGAAASLRDVAARVVRARLTEPDLDPERLCRLTGASRATLFRAFAVDGGIWRFIRTERLRLAARLLREGPDDLVGTVAMRCGFSDHAMFSRQFRQTFGMSPTEARATDPEGRIGPAASDASQWIGNLRALHSLFETG